MPGASGCVKITALSVLVLVGCTHQQSNTPKEPACNDDESPLVTSGTAGLGFHSERGAISTFELSIGMHGNTANTCKSAGGAGSGTYMGSSFTISQDS